MKRAEVTKTSCPPVTIIPISKAERDAKLAEALTDLAELVQRETESLAMLETLLDAARRANGDSDTFAEHMEQRIDAFNRLKHIYSSVGVTEYMEVNGDLANSIEECLGLASGLWLRIHGGSMTGETAIPTAYPVDWLGTQIARFGIAISSAGGAMAESIAE